MISKSIIIKIAEVSAIMAILIYGASKAVSSEGLAPYDGRAYFVMAAYCLLFAIYCFFRLSPSNTSEIKKNVGIATLSQAIAFILVFVILDYPANEDLSRTQWILYRLPVPLIFTAIGAAIVQFLVRFIHRKRSLSIFKKIGT